MIDLNTSIADLNAFNKDTLMDQLGIEYLEVRGGFVRARMPVDQRTKQPLGILHGGASLALAETIGSMGSALLVDLEKFDVRGASEIVDLVDNLFIVFRNRGKEEKMQRAKDRHEPITRDMNFEADTILKVAKQRHGEGEGAIRLWFHPASLQFLPHPDAEPNPFFDNR